MVTGSDSQKGLTGVNENGCDHSLIILHRGIGSLTTESYQGVGRLAEMRIFRALSHSLDFNRYHSAAFAGGICYAQGTAMLPCNGIGNKQAHAVMRFRTAAGIALIKLHCRVFQIFCRETLPAVHNDKSDFVLFRRYGETNQSAEMCIRDRSQNGAAKN